MRSVQLYGVHPAVVREAVRILVEEDLADHVDLNFGCPVPKVTRKGGGAALAYKRTLLRDILGVAVGAAAGRVPVTMKMRTGIDASTLNYLDAGRIAEGEGCAWVALHARTAEQMYGGRADWGAIARLRESVSIPVLGNGDIWEGAVAVAMMGQTGLRRGRGGRGCLGRPWLFGQLAAVFGGAPVPPHPRPAEVTEVMRRQAVLLCEDFGEKRGVRGFRKHVAWYTKGFAVGPRLRQALALVSDLAELDAVLREIDVDQEFPPSVLGVPRGRTTGRWRVALPDGWLADRDDGSVPGDAELAANGG